MVFLARVVSIRSNYRVKISRPTSRPRVTVAIPTYNRADKTLPATLRSAIDQRYANLDIVVSDNCSSDDTEAVVRGHGGRIRYVRQAENLGLNGNLNACVDLAEGDYVLVLHDDDLIDPDFVASCMDAVGDSTSVGLIRTGMRVITRRRSRCIRTAESGDGIRVDGRPDVCVVSWRDRAVLLQHAVQHAIAARRRRVPFAPQPFPGRPRPGEGRFRTRSCARRGGQGELAPPRAATQAPLHSARLANWCEDSLEVMDTICQLEPQRAPELRREGMRFFSRMNYLRVQQIPTLAQRLSGYLLVARAFGFVESPLAASTART